MDAVFSVDVEPDLHTGKFEGIDQLTLLSKMLKQHKIKATFFVTGTVLEKYAQKIRQLKKQGHEIAIHGYAHKRYDLMSHSEQKKDLVQSINAYHSVLKSSPKGFRAPQHSITLELISLLKNLGIKYDSSKTPGNAMLLRHLFKKVNKKEILQNFFSKLKPYHFNGIIEIPRSSFIISTGGFELKLYPKISYKILISLYRIFNIPLIFVMHS